jgi:hypothetical protein
MKLLDLCEQRGGVLHKAMDLTSVIAQTIQWEG